MLCKAYLDLAKIRLTGMVLATVAVGYLLASCEPVNWTRLLVTVFGTGLMAVGAGTLNQLLEIDRDAMMGRAYRRPLPSGTISRAHAFIFAALNTVAGLGALCWFVNPLTAVLGLGNFLLYVLVYTPLKSRTWASLLVGAVCGATPPLMGCAAATGHIALDAIVLAAAVFIWQVPHFLSLAWLYRVDYAKAGYRVLPAVDASGRATCLAIAFFSLMLLPLGLAAWFGGVVNEVVGITFVAIGLWLFVLALRLHARKTADNARRVFLATVTCLPVLLLLMAANRLSLVPRAPDDVRSAEVRQEPIEALPAAAARLDRR
jgi:heme o synthase